MPASNTTLRRIDQLHPRLLRAPNVEPEKVNVPLAPVSETRTVTGRA